jgi:hypothetical protein
MKQRSCSLMLSQDNLHSAVLGLLLHVHPCFGVDASFLFVKLLLKWKLYNQWSQWIT